MDEEDGGIAATIYRAYKELTRRAAIARMSRYDFGSPYSIGCGILGWPAGLPSERDRKVFVGGYFGHLRSAIGLPV